MKIEIVPGCIGCGMCETICSEVFSVGEVVGLIVGADIKSHEESVRKAIDICPIQVIKIINE